MADTVWSHIVALFDGFFRYSVLFLVFTVFTSIMNLFLLFPFKPPSKIRPEGPEALKPGFKRKLQKKVYNGSENSENSENKKKYRVVLKSIKKSPNLGLNGIIHNSG